MEVVTTSERAFRVRRVLPWLKSQKYLSYFAIQQIGFSGDADYILCVRGEFGWLELKRSGRELRPLQKFKADWVEETGGKAFHATPDNWESICSQIAQMGKRRESSD